MCELAKKVNTAIEMLKAYEPDDGYCLCYSGGKDSDCIRILAALSGVKHEIHHNLTTMDAPETVQYIKTIPDIIIDKARYDNGKHKTIWNLIPYKGMPPTRLMRYCCTHLKEQGGKGKLKITGVRAAESTNRKNNGGDIKIIGKPVTMQKYFEENDIEYYKTNQGGLILNYDNDNSRRAVEYCYRTTSTMINPIFTWTTEDVWNFLRYYKCDYNPLYKCGENRVGCVGCSLGGFKQMREDFAKYPAFKENYIRAFDRMLKARRDANKPIYDKWTNGYNVFLWWIGVIK